ncbi:uncharacterized protein LOC113799823 [Dermatophagoides pteronyssinus]|uniref:uncharacterized protein LOC113799823 n=1 Tax=Dermatophagoides pteronyssinus TaxID=6956 RepID=UPI003F6711B3
MNSLFNFEISMWEKFMKNKYFRNIHNHFFYLFHYEQLITKIHNDDQINKLNWKILRPYSRIILVGLISIIVGSASFMLIIQPKWIDNFNYFVILSQMFPNDDGLRYLCGAINLGTINTMFTVFYATSNDLKQFQFLLPIKYARYRYLNKYDSDHYDWIKDLV